jgi:hypothetical protein
MTETLELEILKENITGWIKGIRSEQNKIYDFLQQLADQNERIIKSQTNVYKKMINMYNKMIEMQSSVIDLNEKLKNIEKEA